MDLKAGSRGLIKLDSHVLQSTEATPHPVTAEQLCSRSGGRTVLESAGPP